MKIVLVHPAGSNWVPGRKDVAAVANKMAPLGLLSIAAYLEKIGKHLPERIRKIKDDIDNDF